jgi:hypothetical protein
MSRHFYRFIKMPWYFFTYRPLYQINNALAGIGILFDLADQLSDRTDVGFLFVGRGSDAIRLKTSAQDHGLNNVLFFDDIHPDDNQTSTHNAMSVLSH